MLKGDLASTPLDEVLRQLADGAATGCLHVVDGAGEKAQVYLRGGRIYSVVAPGRRPQLGARLVSSGALGPEALAEALEAQRTELQGWRLGELLVHMGYVDQPVVEDFVNEQVRASLSDLLPWRHATWRFRVNERTREDVAPPVDVPTLLAEIDGRHGVWAEIERTVHGPDAVPLLSAAGTASGETEIDADAWSLLCKVDGTRTVTELARECGFTLYEAGQVVFTLVSAGLLEVEEAELVVEAEQPAPLLPREAASRLASALGGLGVPSPRDEPARGLELPADDAAVTGSISRVSEALSAMLGPATASDDVFGAPVHRPTVPTTPVEDPKKLERDRRAAARRDRDAAELAEAQAELAEAQAELEAAKAEQEAQFAELHGADHVAEVVDLREVRAAAEALAAAEDERLEAEAAEQARLDEEARLAAEAEAEAARVAEEERVAAEQARLDEEARLAAEVEAEAARVAAEAEAARVAEEAEAARVAEEERLAAEQARLDEAQVAAEAEAARVAEEERLAAEAAEQARLDEEAQLAAEAEAARLAEEERLAAAAAEQARLDEEARLAAEAEAARLAEEERLAAAAAEQARLDEEARLAAEAEAARLAEEERLAAEAAEAAEQARLAEQELRLAQERQAAEQAAAAEQARLEDEARRAQEAAAAAEFAALTADLDDDRGDDFDPEIQAAAFAELSASAAYAAPEPAAREVETPAVDEEPLPSYAYQDTDTASLLRELSSLGMDDDPPPPPLTRPVRPTAPRPISTVPAKKRKGLFGR